MRALSTSVHLQHVQAAGLVVHHHQLARARHREALRPQQPRAVGAAQLGQELARGGVMHGDPPADMWRY